MNEGIRRFLLCSFAFAVPLPPIVEMQKEYGEQLVACGLVGAAMEIFERLELWDNLLICYRLLEKVPQALDLVHKRLEASLFHCEVRRLGSGLLMAVRPKNGQHCVRLARSFNIVLGDGW